MKFKIGDEIICKNTGYFVSNASVKGKIIGNKIKKTLFGKKINIYYVYTEDFNKINYAVNSLVLEINEKDIFLNS